MSTKTTATTIAFATITALALITLAFIQQPTNMAAQAAKLPKVVICHVGFDEETNSTSFTTLNVNAHAVPKHIANHGDTLGPCP